MFLGTLCPIHNCVTSANPPVPVSNHVPVLTSSCLDKLFSNHSNPTLNFLRCLCACFMYLGNMYLVFLDVLFVLGVCISFRPPLCSSLSRSQLSPQSVQEWAAHCFDGHRWESCDQFFYLLTGSIFKCFILVDLGGWGVLDSKSLFRNLVPFFDSNSLIYLKKTFVF